MPPARILLVGCCFLVFSLGIFSGCSRKDSPERQPEEVVPHQGTKTSAWPPDNRRSDVYVGSIKCAECHREIYDTYFAQHPMGKSINKLDAAEGKLPFPTIATLRNGPREYHVFREANGRLEHAESMSDTEGEIYRQTVNVDFAVGSGTRGYSFITENNGCLYQSSLTWYSQGQRWDLSPGYQSDSHPGFGRRITQDCIFCHAGQVNRIPGSRDRFDKPIFMEASIGCERCHGPGESHCQKYLTGAVNLVDNIVNPGKLTPAKRDSVCYQCHLHGEDRILKHGRSSFDFRPGDLLSDVWVVLTTDHSRRAKTSQFNAVSQAEQMISSDCYRKSNGSLGCISCHSPHSTPTETHRVEFYRSKCMDCHDHGQTECTQPLHQRLLKSPKDSCIQCHMPKAPASDVPHTAQTDHRILKSYSGAETSASPSKLRSFEAPDFPVTRAELQRALGLQLEQHASTVSDARQALTLLADAIGTGTDNESSLAASWLHLKLGNTALARDLAAMAIRLDPESESAHEAMAIALQQEKKPDAALKHLNQVIEKAPWSSVLQVQKAELLVQLGKMESAVQALRTASDINPFNVQLRGRLIETLKSVGRHREATQERVILQRILKRKKLLDTDQ